MVSLAQAKTLGGIGSILVLLSIIPRAGGLLALVGLVLILVAVKYISDALEDKSIFNNMLISLILAIAGIIVGILFAAAVLISSFGEWRGEPSMIMGPRFYTILPALLLAIAPIWIFYIVSAIYLRKSYDTIASKLNIDIFRTAALVYLIGAVLSIVLIGFFLIFVAEILQAVAFFSIPEKEIQPSQPATQLA